MIALLHADDPAYVHEAAKRGVFAYIVDAHAGGAAERDRHHAPAVHRVPQPPGCIRTPRGDRAGEGDPDGPQRDQRRQRPSSGSATTRSTTGSKLSDVAAAVVESHLLLLPPMPPSAEQPAAVAVAGDGRDRLLSSRLLKRCGVCEAPCGASTSRGREGSVLSSVGRSTRPTDTSWSAIEAEEGTRDEAPSQTDCVPDGRASKTRRH